MRLLSNGQPRQRRGVILVVVLAMLTLFALVGISFVLVADSQANAARIAREGESAFRPDIDPEGAFSLFLSQLIYDVPDTVSGYDSALRGQSLTRNMYGFNPTMLNDKPYSGTGRLHAAGPNIAGAAGVATDDAFLMNFLYFTGDGWIRDPERPGNRAAGAVPLPYLGGFGVPYTYPDHNNFYLAEIDPATGEVIVPSFHREYLFGRLDDATNPNWTNAQGKYLTLRPTRALNPNFPLPVDRGGDVKNLDFAPGGCDSTWVDIGAPVMTAADGRKYKMLVAPLILALDGRLDVNTVGNVMASLASPPPAAPFHRSNQGWGTWEVNPWKVLNADATGGNPPTEWTALFNGSAKNAVNLSRLRGRYDQGTGAPLPFGSAISGTNQPRAWAPVDYNGMMDSNGNASAQYTLPAAGSNSAYLGFPLFPGTTYGNGGMAENPNHASIYNALRPRGTNRRFPIESAAGLLRMGGSGSDMLVSDVSRLLPQNLVTGPGAVMRRNLITLLSADLERPGATPYVWDPNDASNPTTRFQLLVKPQVMPNPPENTYAPQNQPIPFPAVAPAAPPPVGPPASEFDASYRSNLAALLRLDLSRPLTKYPTPDATTGLMLTTDPALAQATLDRQNFARDVFNVLQKVTGALDPATAYNSFGKNSPEYRGVRYLAQLAVNIVDQIDGDDVSTPFNWANFTATDKTVVNEFVFGVELPRLVVNETYVSFDNAVGSLDATGTKVDPTKTYNVNVWVELHNPMPNDSSADTTAHLSTAAGVNAAYRILLADADLNGTPTSVLRDPANALGDPDFGTPAGTMPGQAASRIRSVMSAWGNAGGATPDPQTVTPGGGVFSDPTNKNVGFYAVGPDTSALFLDNVKDNPNLPVTISSKSMTYSVSADPTVTTSTPRPTVLLQRLANPSLPLDPLPTSPTYNPYITVDFAENTTAQVMDGRRFDTNGGIATTPAITTRFSVGRTQPYAGFLGQRMKQAPVTPAVNQALSTFFRQNCTADNSAALDAAKTDTTLKVPFDWLTHLDRYPTNPLELLQVSDARPHDLTQRFVTGSAMNSPAQQHIAPWDQGNARLYRFFEFIMSGTRGTADPNGPAGVVLPGPGGRVVGKVNLNGVWNKEILRALADAQGGNSFTEAQVDAIFTAMLDQRSPGSTAANKPVIGPTDQTLARLSGQPLQRPFWSLALGAANAADDGTTVLNPDPFLRQVATRGVENTLLQAPGGTPLFETGLTVTHPYQKKELLRKMFGSLTTRSNVFAVWATVGYFEVEDATVRPVKLGKEIGFDENRQFRHRMFAIVDRTQLQQWPTFVRGQTTPTVSSTAAVAVTDASGGTVNSITLSTNTFTRADGAPLATGAPYTWTLQNGGVLVFEPNTDNEETVVVTPGPMGVGFQAAFRKNHAAGVPVVVRGNPGPLIRYNPRQDRDVVPYFALID